MRINTNLAVWPRMLGFAVGAVYLWRSAIHPNASEPQKAFDRAIRLIGAILLSIVTSYFLGYGLGLYGAN